MRIGLTTFLLAAAELAGWPCLAQGNQLNMSGATNCTMADFDFALEFASGNFFSVTLKQRNISDHSCTMDGQRYGIDFVPFNRGAVSCYDCPTHSLQEAYSPNPPIIVESGRAVQQTFRWKIVPQGDKDTCLKPDWMTGPVLLVAPSLLTNVCGEMEVSQMAPAPEADQEPAPQLKLTSLKPAYVAGETFAVQVSAVKGEPLPEDTACPTLYLRERSPDGTTRVDEVRPLAFKGCERHVLGHTLGDWASGFDVDSGATSRWFGVGQNVMEVFQLRHSRLDSELHLVSSNVLRFPVVDPETMPRKWAGRADGIGVDVTLDKDTYALGEDVPLHMAVENMDAAVPIYSGHPQMDPCMVVRIEILDSGGRPVPAERRFQQTSICTGHGFGAAPYEKGKVVALERSLGMDGLLPNAPGTYTIAVSWAPGTGSEDPQVARTTEMKPVGPVHAATTIHIVSGEAAK